MKHLVYSALVHVVYSRVSGQYSYAIHKTRKVDDTRVVATFVQWMNKLISVRGSSRENIEYYKQDGVT